MSEEMAPSSSVVPSHPCSVEAPLILGRAGGNGMAPSGICRLWNSCGTCTAQPACVPIPAVTDRCSWQPAARGAESFPELPAPEGLPAGAGHVAVPAARIQHGLGDGDAPGGDPCSGVNLS